MQAQDFFPLYGKYPKSILTMAHLERMDFLIHVNTVCSVLVRFGLSQCWSEFGSVYSMCTQTLHLNNTFIAELHTLRESLVQL